MVPAQIEMISRPTGNGEAAGCLSSSTSRDAAGQLLLAGLVQVGSERGERLELAVLGEVDAQAAGDVASSPWAAPHHRRATPRCRR